MTLELINDITSVLSYMLKGVILPVHAGHFTTVCLNGISSLPTANLFS